MSMWQVILVVFFVLLPLALMSDFHPDGERLSARGKPLPREWRRQVEHPAPDDAH